MRVSKPGTRQLIETIDHNRLFRATAWILRPWGILVVVAGAIALFILLLRLFGVDQKKPNGELLALLPIAPTVLVMMLPRISQWGRKVGHNRVPIRQLRRSLKAQRVRVPRFAYISPIGIAACVVFVVGAFVLVLAFSEDIDGLTADWKSWRKTLAKAAVAGIFAGALLLVRYFKRRGDETIAIVGTAPVVLVTTSEDDLTQKTGVGTGQVQQTYAQSIGRVLKPYGPFVGIGKTGKGLALLDAAQTGVDDETWHQKSLEMMRSARLIALIAGTTAGLRWEVAQIVANGWTGKLIVLLPMVKAAERTKRLALFAESLAGTPWQGALAGADGAGAVAIRLEPDGRATIIAATGDGGEHPFFNDAVIVALHGLLCPAQQQVVGVSV